MDSGFSGFGFRVRGFWIQGLGAWDSGFRGLGFRV